MKKITLSVFAISLLLIVTIESRAQVAIHFQNKKKYEKKYKVGELPEKHLKKHDFRITSKKKAAKKTGTAEYDKALRKETRKTSKIAARYVKHPKHSAKIKSDQVGI